MPKLTKDLLIVAPGEIYPRQLRAGDDCPEWAFKVAESVGCLEKPAKKMPQNKAIKSAPENKGGA